MAIVLRDQRNMRGISQKWGSKNALTPPVQKYRQRMNVVVVIDATSGQELLTDADFSRHHEKAIKQKMGRDNIDGGDKEEHHAHPDGICLNYPPSRDHSCKTMKT